MLINVIYTGNEYWSFRGADTKYLAHGLHVYPARTILYRCDSIKNMIQAVGIKGMIPLSLEFFTTTLGFENYMVY